MNDRGMEMSLEEKRRNPKVIMQVIFRWLWGGRGGGEGNIVDTKSIEFDKELDLRVEK